MGDNIQKLPPLVVITGPTATGKSEVGVMVAEKLGGQIISADSAQVYRGMDIGTAKPTPAERQGITHHLIDIVDPDQEYSAALFQEQARTIISDLTRRKILPVMVGGTGLYIRAVIDPFNFSNTKGDPLLRKRLLKEATLHGPEALHGKLSEVDPVAASRLHPRDLRRVIRALEVYYLTGETISSHQSRDETGKPLYNLFMFGLTMARDKLYKRIEERVDKMIAAGLIDEVRRLLEKGYSPELSSMRSLGYKEIIKYLSGELTLEQAVEILKRNTRRFAKRQLTWFRRDQRIKWLDLDKLGGLNIAAQKITDSLEGVL
ncbi:MAG TPA: tRNA (adenosine(37)-N6)-dimethylallyltransferase MiaA [Bacillota bacterium]|jgi:tRNA dimethylallyltransferase|nr:tRNA (adenosine(37)-N6)-dimethylallyltransferase MiaA [Peptococcaceae bacterium MAG4]HPU35332.1 tRNA (adenosine(37)-N6)-dimethylallyltransferase MiaA [Bacillota bacterium]HPZ42393.1 tRNA (adenosine(37)-N6)-dimethylallyltransferase MiaA [Bacillota bacterium]HQD75059.1 tRNA (adenosine(37)-N6)-dimethylallyltransferase MiaA [Bacillota bacterium]HUM57616.1 tRNA (adenosine(37)-N6)-dimethylallyltransferase MiaA [Bacillota bacterium]